MLRPQSVAVVRVGIPGRAMAETHIACWRSYDLSLGQVSTRRDGLGATDMPTRELRTPRFALTPVARTQRWSNSAISVSGATYERRLRGSILAPLKPVDAVGTGRCRGRCRASREDTRRRRRRVKEPLRFTGSQLAGTPGGAGHRRGDAAVAAVVVVEVAQWPLARNEETRLAVAQALGDAGKAEGGSANLAGRRVSHPQPVDTARAMRDWRAHSAGECEQLRICSLPCLRPARPLLYRSDR